MAADVLTRFIEHGDSVLESYSKADWGLLIRNARRTKLLSSLASKLQESSGMAYVPPCLQWQLSSALKVGESSARSVRWEVRQIHNVLNGANIRFALLKGAAYEMAQLAPSKGRLYVDVDILVDKNDISRAEEELGRAGWMPSKMDSYDQRYYRQWMHEIPPLQHMYRKTSLDVHHTILPPTAKLKPQVSLLWQDAIEMPGWPSLYVLAPFDMILHSATHLFHDGDLEGGLRDLVDLDALLGQFSQEKEFWTRLLERAESLDLVRPLFYALKYTRSLLGTEIPDELMSKLNKSGPPLIIESLMDVLIRRAFNPSRENLDSGISGFAKWLLFVRSHYLRMPLYLLVPHLTRKALRSEKA